MRACLLALALVLVGCGGEEPVATVEAAPAAPGPAECAVCGMTVRDQPAPRGQVLHRDGGHAHFCSLGDLRAYLQTPSSRGAPVGVWVEDLGAGFEVMTFDTAFRPWIPAADATFVVGANRPRIMGLPILSFSSPSAATEHTAGEAHAVDWTALRSTPFHAIPPETP